MALPASSGLNLAAQRHSCEIWKIEGEAILLSLNGYRQAHGHQQMADMWLHQQLAGHPPKLTHIAAISDGAPQQQTLWDSCSLWSPSKLLYDSCFPDFLKARSTLLDLYSHACSSKGSGNSQFPI